MSRHMNKREGVCGGGGGWGGDEETDKDSETDRQDRLAVRQADRETETDGQFQNSMFLTIMYLSRWRTIGLVLLFFSTFSSSWKRNAHAVGEWTYPRFTSLHHHNHYHHLPEALDQSFWERQPTRCVRHKLKITCCERIKKREGERRSVKLFQPADCKLLGQLFRGRH